MLGSGARSLEQFSCSGAHVQNLPARARAPWNSWLYLRNGKNCRVGRAFPWKDLPCHLRCASPLERSASPAHMRSSRSLGKIRLASSHGRRARLPALLGGALEKFSRAGSTPLATCRRRKQTMSEDGCGSKNDTKRPISRAHAIDMTCYRGDAHERPRGHNERHSHVTDVTDVTKYATDINVPCHVDVATQER